MRKGFVGPSGAVQAVSDSRRPLLLLFLHFNGSVPKTTEGHVIGF